MQGGARYQNRAAWFTVQSYETDLLWGLTEGPAAGMDQL